MNVATAPFLSAVNKRDLLLRNITNMFLKLRYLRAITIKYRNLEGGSKDPPKIINVKFEKIISGQSDFSDWFFFHQIWILTC